MNMQKTPQRTKWQLGQNHKPSLQKCWWFEEFAISVRKTAIENRLFDTWFNWKKINTTVPDQPT